MNQIKWAQINLLWKEWRDYQTDYSFIAATLAIGLVGFVKWLG